MTLLLDASSSRQLLIAVVSHFLFHYPQLRYSMYPLSLIRLRNLRYPFCFLRCFHEIHCISVGNLRPPHAPVTATCPASFTIRCSHDPWEKNRCDIRLYPDGHTDRQTGTYPPPPPSGIVGVAIMALHHQTT